jgi:general L-amino acid transport system permease protein
MSQVGAGSRSQIPFYRDERVLAGAFQAAVLLLALVAVVYLVSSVKADLAEHGLAPGLGFLDQVAGFGIGEGIGFEASEDSYGRAFVVGMANTLRVASIGIVLATGLGFVIALARLSGNPLLGRLASSYIEVFRNTPLLVQLIFWYQGVVLRLPDLQQSLAIGREGEGSSLALAYLSQRGLALPRLLPRDSANTWFLVCALSILAAWWAARWRLRRQERSGQPAHALFTGAAIIASAALVAWWIAPQPPFGHALPELGRYTYASGLVLSPEFTALTLGLVTYSAAFIAEVIRGGIQAVSSGQREAARALGLNEAQSLRLVVMPQAMRVIIPPLTSQYLNLTKNSTLAIYIGFPDLFNVSLTIGNNTGQFVVVTAMIMAVYLALSLLTSLFMNTYNRRIQLVER